MKVSVVVPVYNVEKYIDCCMNSLLNQTYKPYEIILVDDGSTDNSGVIAENYSKEYDYIKVIHKENAGLGFARNTGLDNATGDWVVFLDSDDYFDTNLLELLIENQKKYNADVVVGGYKKVDSDGNVLFEYSYENSIYKNDEVQTKLLPRFLGSSPTKSDSMSMSVCNCLFSLELIKKNNILFPSERKVISEDLFFNFDYYRSAKTVVLIKEVAYNYRTILGSLTTTYRPDRFELCKSLYNEMQKKIDDNELGNEFKIRLMRSMFNYWRMCFAQEERIVSKKKYKQIKRDVKKILCDDTTRKMIKLYPIQELGIKQKVFLYIVKYNMADVITVLIHVGFFRIS